MRCCDFLLSISKHSELLVHRYLGCTVNSLPSRQCPRWTWGLSNPGPRCAGRMLPGIVGRGDDRISHVPEKPQVCLCHGPRPRRATRVKPDCDQSARSPQRPRRGHPAKIGLSGLETRLQHSLSTLRSKGYPNTTQDSLPAAGQALPDGLIPARFQRKVSVLFPYITSPFPKHRGARSGPVSEQVDETSPIFRRFFFQCTRVLTCPV